MPRGTHHTIVTYLKWEEFMTKLHQTPPPRKAPLSLQPLKLYPPRLQKPMFTK